MADRFGKFTERARRVLTYSMEEAHRFNHNYIGTEHILLGLIRENDGIVSQVFVNLGIEIEKARKAVEFIIGRGDRTIVGEIGLTPRSKKVIELAVDEARRLNQEYIGAEHILAGLVREGEGIAAGVLESLGAPSERVRAEIVRLSGEKRITPLKKEEIPITPKPQVVNKGLSGLIYFLKAVLSDDLNQTVVDQLRQILTQHNGETEQTPTLASLPKPSLHIARLLDFLYQFDAEEIEILINELPRKKE